MRHRWGRWSLVVLAAAVAAGAVAWTLRMEGEVRDIRGDAVAASGYARNGRTALQDVRRALAAMASPGQAAAGWSRRAEAALDDARRQVEALTAMTPGGDRPGALDVIERLAESERRVREHATGGKPLMAADVAFGEAMPHVADLERRLDGALEAVSSTADGAVAARRDRQVAALAGALAVLLLAAMALAPIPSPGDVPAAPAAPARADLLGTVPATSPEPDLPDAMPAPAAIPDAPPVDLVALGGICGRLASMRDADALPALLEEAAQAIGASGLMLWLAEPSRQHLRIGAAAGYDARVVDRIGTVAVTDDHVTARAYRSAALVTAAARTGQPAAAAVPITGPDGVSGVVSVELTSNAAAALAASVAAVQIVAAQLSLLVAPAAGGDDTTLVVSERQAQG